MRIGDIVTAIVGTLLVVVGLGLWLPGAACACTRAHAPSSPTLASVARIVASTQVQHRARSGAFADSEQALGLSPLPAGFDLVDVHATDTSYAVRIAGQLDGRRRTCTVAGHGVSADSISRFTLDCVDESPAR